MNAIKALAARARGLEMVSAPIVPMDEDGLPNAACPKCAGCAYHREPGQPWRCAACAPAILPEIEHQAGWAFCGAPS